MRADWHGRLFNVISQHSLNSHFRFGFEAEILHDIQTCLLHGPLQNFAGQTVKISEFTRDKILVRQDLF